MVKKKRECRICKIINDRLNPYRICELELSVVGLNPDQFFRGYTLVAFKRHVTELYHLPPKERMAFCEEMIRVASALEDTFHPDKMNYALLGNVNAHMHWHLIPRYKTDPLWGQPVWSQPHKEKRLRGEEYYELIRRIREQLERM